MLIGVQQGPLMVRRRDAGGAEPAFWVSVHRQSIQGSPTGNFDVTVPGLTFTPKAMRIIYSGCQSDGVAITSGGGVRGAIGAYDGTNQWTVSWSNLFSSIETYGGAGRILNAFVGGGDGVVSAVAFIPGGVRLNQAVASSADLITIEFFGGTALDAQAGTVLMGTTDVGVDTNVGFQARAIFTGTNFTAMAPTLTGQGPYSIGLASYDGVTITQANFGPRLINTGGNRWTDGLVSNNRIATWAGATSGIELTGIDSDSFILTPRNSLSGNRVGYLALGGIDAHVAIYDTPASTGAAPMAGVSFAPKFASIMPTRLTTVNTNNQEGQAYAYAIASLTPTDEYMTHYRSTDAFGSGGTVQDLVVSDDVAIAYQDHRGLNSVAATLQSFDSDGVTLNYSATVSGLKTPAIFLG